VTLTAILTTLRVFLHNTKVGIHKSALFISDSDANIVQTKYIGINEPYKHIGILVACLVLSYFTP
jgi:hypothetical protein